MVSLPTPVGLGHLGNQTLPIALTLEAEGGRVRPVSSWGCKASEAALMLIPFFCLCIAFNIVNQETAQIPYPDLFLNTWQQHQGWGDRDNRVIILRPRLSRNGKPPSLCFWGQSYSEPWNKTNDRFFSKADIFLITSNSSPYATVVHKSRQLFHFGRGSYCCQCFGFSSHPNSDVVAPGSW